MFIRSCKQVQKGYKKEDYVLKLVNKYFSSLKTKYISQSWSKVMG